MTMHLLLTGIVDYMIEQSGPPSKQIQTSKQVQEFVKDGDDVIIIGVFKGDQDPAYQIYQDAGKPFCYLQINCSHVFNTYA